MLPEFVVPLTPQDLPSERTYEQICASLSALQQASDGVFARIKDVVEDRRGRLDELLEQLHRIEAKISSLSNCSQPLAAQASALYPELDALRSWHPLFPSRESLDSERLKDSSPGGVLPLPTELPAENDDRVRGQDTADLLHFFKQAQAASSSIITQGPPTSIPENLTSATSLLRYGDTRAAFGAAELDSATGLMPTVSSSLTLHKAPASRRVPELGRPSPPQPFGFQEQPVPALSLPRTLPELDASSQRSSSARSGSGRAPEPPRPRVPWDPAFAGTGRQTSLESRSYSALSGTGGDQYPGRGAGQSSSDGPKHSRTADTGAPEQATGHAELAADVDAPTDSMPSAALEPAWRHVADPNTAEEKSPGSADSDQANSTEQSPAGTSTSENDPASAQEARQMGGQPDSQSEAGSSRQATNGQATKWQQMTSQKRPPRSLPSSRGGSAEALDAQAGGLPPPVVWPGTSSAVPGDPGSDGPPSWRFAHVGDVATALDKQVDLGALGGVPVDLEHSIMLRQRSLSSRASIEEPKF
ncbi:probable WASH complex subunit 1 at N-terminal half [Coccomyxa sp. Obi]|nr:probable WASH complex subunit 1 at N-terminal half [Coccomyxa sp. Obi]